MVAISNESKKKTSIFPDFPRGTPVITKDGDFTQHWRLGLSSLFQACQKNFTNEGIQVPQLTRDEINLIKAIYTPLIGSNLGIHANISGKIVYDITDARLAVFIITFFDPLDASSVITSADWYGITTAALP